MTTLEGWSAWHPKHGFNHRYGGYGPIAYATLDDVTEQVKMLNDDDGTTNRNGWRAVKVTVAKC